jgi:hypothetical protein
MINTLVEKPAMSSIEITSDLITIKCLLEEMTAALNAGPKSRERSLVITKLQEAQMWANQAQIADFRAEDAKQ